jgi:DnaK suppressor protein
VKEAVILNNLVRDAAHRVEDQLLESISRTDTPCAALSLHKGRNHESCPGDGAASEGAAGTMATTKSTKATAKTSRYNELRQMLEDRRRELMNEVQGRIRDVRADGNKDRDVLDQGESSEVDIQEDIEFALIQMKSETLNKINEALNRLEEGTYGNCFECGEEIAHARLRALPFAVRCKDCEEARETAEQRERAMSQKRGSATLFFDMSN